MGSAESTVEVYQLRIWIRKISPQICRRLLVRSDTTIAQLHEILQIAFGWQDEHLNQFLIRGKPYGVWKPGGMIFDDNPRQVRLCDFHFRLKETWAYEYDLTDWWQHEIRLEQILPLDPQKQYPICTAGQRRSPIEDCGGPWAFMELQDEHPQWKVLPEFAQLLLDHQDDPENYQKEFRCLAYWVAHEHFDRKVVNRRLAEFAARGGDLSCVSGYRFSLSPTRGRLLSMWRKSPASSAINSPRKRSDSGWRKPNRCWRASSTR